MNVKSRNTPRADAAQCPAARPWYAVVAMAYAALGLYGTVHAMPTVRGVSIGDALWPAEQPHVMAATQAMAD